MPIRYLDDQNESQTPVTGSNGKSSAMQAFGQMGGGPIIGGLNKIEETTSNPILGLLGKLGIKPAQRENERFNAYLANHEKLPNEDLGSKVADALMMTPFAAPEKAALGVPAWLLRAISAGLQGAAVHGGQRYGTTGEVGLGQAAGEGFGTAALEAGTEALPGLFKLGGAATLKGLTRAKGSLQRGLNAPTIKGYARALEEGVINPLSFAKSAKNGMMNLVNRDAARAANLAENNVRSNVMGGAFPAAEKDVLSRVTGSKGLLPEETDAAIAELESLRDAARRPGVGMDAGGWMDGPDAIEFRKMLDKKTKPTMPDRAAAGKAVAARASRRAIEGDLLARMAGKPGEAAYVANKTAMSELAPVTEALEDRATTNYSLWPELGMGGFGLGAAAAGHPGTLALAPLLAAARRTPLPAWALYQPGKFLASPAGQVASRVGLNLSRTGMYGDNQ